MLSVLLLSNLLSAADLPRTFCPAGQLGQEFIGDALPGVELLAGVRTGMTRDEVREVAPTLLPSESRARVELFPGMTFLAVANYARAGKGASGVTLRGPASKAPMEELSKRFGEPIKVDDLTVTEPFEPLGVRSFGVHRLRTLKWCDGPRVLVMQVDNDAFRLTITAERAPKDR